VSVWSGLKDVGAVVEAVEEVIRVAVDADTLARAERDARVGHLLPRRVRLRAHARLRNDRSVIELDLIAVDQNTAALPTGEDALDDDVALLGARAEQLRRKGCAGGGDELVDAVVDARPTRARARDLLADHRRQIGVERDDHRLDVRLFGVIEAERAGAEEAEQRIDAAVVQVPEARICGPWWLKSPESSGENGMPNIPTFWYAFRRCGILNSCVSPSMDELPLPPKKPFVGLSVWQPLQFRMTSVTRPLVEIESCLLVAAPGVRPACGSDWADRSAPSRSS
jgi:hypothetical protein